MKKKEFLNYNDVLLSLYTCTSYEQLQAAFLPQLKQLIPCSYLSFVLNTSDPETGNFSLNTPLCYPDHFKKAEELYCRYANEDGLLWLALRHDYTVIKESDLIADEERLSSAIYQKCYKDYDIYDTLQDFIVWQGRMLGVLTLFRTSSEEPFTEDSLFYLRSLSRHLNTAMNRILKGRTSPAGFLSAKARDRFVRENGLSVREAEILGLLCRFCSNTEIAEKLGIRENTVQKHLQNLFHKCGAASRWELLRILEENDRT